jgi:hypothetical protein
MMNFHKITRIWIEEEERTQYANQIGADGWALLAALDAPSTAESDPHAGRAHLARYTERSDRYQQLVELRYALRG